MKTTSTNEKGLPFDGGFIPDKKSKKDSPIEQIRKRIVTSIRNSRASRAIDSNEDTQLFI